MNKKLRRSLQSESLKVKGSGQWRLLILVPFITIFVAFLMAGPTILVSFSVYWWEALFLILLISLLFLNDFNLEKKAGNFQNVRLLPEAAELLFAKILLIFCQLIIASLFFLLFTKLVSLLYAGILVFSAAKVLLSLMLMLIALLWNLPLLYLLANWLNPYILLAGNSLLCLLLAPLIAQSPVWFIFPYSYHYKVAQILLAVKPSGDVLRPVPELDFVSLGLAIALSLLLTGIFSYLLKRRSFHVSQH